MGKNVHIIIRTVKQKAPHKCAFSEPVIMGVYKKRKKVWKRYLELKECECTYDVWIEKWRLR